MKLREHNLRDLREGLEFRQRYYAQHDGAVRTPSDDARELDLALRWFRNWWQQRAEGATRRSLRECNADPTGRLF